MKKLLIIVCLINILITNAQEWSVKIKQDQIEDYISDKTRQVINDPVFELINQGNTFKIRIPYTGTEDVLMNISRNINQNGCYDFSSAFTIPIGGNLITSTGDRLHGAAGDDTCPVIVNGMYLGGNHGCTGLRIVNSNAHGKTLADVGSVWIDGAGVNFFLLKVVDGNNLWLISQNTHPSDGYNFVNITGNLTYVSGAVNTGGITVSGQTTSQLYPGVKNLQQSIFIDGNDATSNGTYIGSNLNFVESYDIIDTPDMVAKLVSNRPVGGYLVQPDFTDGVALMTIKNTYKYVKGGVIVFADIINRKQSRFSSFGGTQVSYFRPSWASEYKRYVPHTTPLNGYDYRIPTSIVSAPPLSNNYTTATWENGIAPFRVVDEINNGVKSINFSVGFLPLGLGSNLENYVSNALTLFTTRKIYPNLVTGDKVNDLNTANSLSPGKGFDGAAFRIWSPKGNITNSFCFELNNKVYLYIDSNTTGYFTYDIDEKYTGYKITPVKKSTNFTLLSTLIQNKVDFSITTLDNGYSYLVAELTPSTGTSSATNFTNGSIPFSNALGNLIQSNPTLFYDNTNKRLGVGTNTPTATGDFLGIETNTGVLNAKSSSTNGRGTIYGIGASSTFGSFISQDANGACIFSFGMRYDGVNNQYVRVYTAANNYLPFIRWKTDSTISIGGTASNLTSNTNPTLIDWFTLNGSNGRLTLGGAPPIASPGTYDILLRSTSTSEVNRVNILPGPHGGTGLSSFTVNSYFRALSSTAMEQRTPSQVLSDIGGAPINAPTFTGDAKAETQSTSDNDTSIATTAFTHALITLSQRSEVNTSYTGPLRTNTELEAQYPGRGIPYFIGEPNTTGGPVIYMKSDSGIWVNFPGAFCLP